MPPMQPPSGVQPPSLPSISTGGAFVVPSQHKLPSISQANGAEATAGSGICAPGQPSHAFDLLLQASMDEAEIGIESSKDQQQEDFPSDSKDADDEEEDKDFCVEDSDVAEDDDDEEYFDSHMERKKQSAASRRTRSRRSAPKPTSTHAQASLHTGTTGGALDLVTRLAGPQFLETLDPVQVHFLSVLPGSAYGSRTTTDELLAMKCNNRECAQVRGNAKKPNSIYCSSKCQSREQNLRQGRVKNVRRLSSSPVLTIAKQGHKKKADRLLKQRPASLPSAQLPASVFNASASLTSRLSMNIHPTGMGPMHHFDSGATVPQQPIGRMYAPHMATHHQGHPLPVHRSQMPSMQMRGPMVMPQRTDMASFARQSGGMPLAGQAVKREPEMMERVARTGGQQPKLAISYLLSAGTQECRNLDMLQLPPPFSSLPSRGGL